jgi:hypothetical protein
MQTSTAAASSIDELRGVTGRLALVGVLAWCVVAWWIAPDPLDQDWARLLLLLAPFVCLPLLLPELLAHEHSSSTAWRPRGRTLVVWWICASSSFGISQFLAPGPTAVATALPWALLLATFGAHAALGLLHLRRLLRSPATFCVGAAPLLGLVGAAWSIFDRLGVRPLDLHSEIVLLTAIHFHFAGIVLPLVTSHLLRGARGPLAWWTAWLVVGGVPFVAVGITVVQWGGPLLIESVAAWCMAAGGVLVSARLLGAARRVHGIDRVLAASAGSALFAGMTLACLYAARHQLTLAWFDIPWMRGVHGSLNALGFGVLAALFVARSERTGPAAA